MYMCGVAEEGCSLLDVGWELNPDSGYRKMALAETGKALEDWRW